MTQFSRRNFLSAAGAGGLLAAIAPGTAWAADTSGYKALVCISLLGGMDHADTILPTDQPSYDALYDTRSGILDNYRSGVAPEDRLSRDIDNLLPLSADNIADYGGRTFGLPPQMSALHELFERGDAAIIGNMGPLVQPVTRDEVNRRTVPDRLFSHNDQISTFLSLGPEGARIGWGGRFVDALTAANSGDGAYSAISLAGFNVFLSGNQTRIFQINGGGPYPLTALNRRSFLGSGSDSSKARRLMADHFSGAGVTSDNFYINDIADSQARAATNITRYRETLSSIYSFTTQFPRSPIGAQLKNVAETISLRNQLGVGRQIFYCAIAGFDTHNDQANSLPALQRQLSDALMAFQNAMAEINETNNVTTFTASEFGRTTIGNGDGTDHGWGGHHFVVGGAVNGKRIYGDIPPYDLGLQTYLASRGVLIPTLSVEQYAATLGAWFGLNPAELNEALPNLRNFDEANLGFV
ncbi:MAG: DUF1501 domain-containing protein [Pseudomonadota bacterium]